MNNPEYEYFDIIVKSKDALGNVYNTATPPVIQTSTPHNLDFNFSSVYDNAPALQRYADAPYCDIKVKYFQIDETTTNFDTANTLTIQVKVNVALPNSSESKRITDGNSNNIITTRTIGYIPTGVSSTTYSDSQFDNQFVKVSNPFKGVVNIQLHNQDDAILNLDADNPYFMVLCVRFHKNPNLFNNV